MPENEAKRCFMRSWSYWSHKTLESNTSLQRKGDDDLNHRVIDRKKQYRSRINRGEKRDCSRDSGFDMDRAGDRFYTTGPKLFFQRSQRCSDRVNTRRTPRS